MKAFSKAIGISRTPDTKLVKNPRAMHARLNELCSEVSRLEAAGILAVDKAADVKESEVHEAWEPILESFRVLTVSATASGERLDPSFTATMYEAAADAALLGGNLAFYLSCQSRLIGDLYPQLKHLGEPPPERADEFAGYNLLYFGVLTVDSTELAVQLRRLGDSSSPGVLFALKAITCVLTQNAFGFLDLYMDATTRQRSVMQPRLEAMRDMAAQTIIRTYLSLETKHAQNLLHVHSTELVFKTILNQKPELAVHNKDHQAPVIILRVPKLKK